MTTCYINGNYKDILKSKVSITDRGFQFSDGIYEVIAVYKDRFVDIDLHLNRLIKSLNRLKNDFEKMQILYFENLELIKK